MPVRPTSHFRESLLLDPIPNATPTSDGVMSAPDKARLDALVSGGFAIVSRSTNFTAEVLNHYRVDTSSGDVTATPEAPSAANAGQDISFKKLTSAGTLAITSSALIDGGASISVTTQFTAVTIRSTGSTWDIV